MKLEQLRRQGSQELDEMSEFVLTSDRLEIYEAVGNGDYYLAREYKVKMQRFIPVFDIEADDLDRLMKPLRFGGQHGRL
jgi:hypothetical protein